MADFYLDRMFPEKRVAKRKEKIENIIYSKMELENIRKFLEKKFLKLSKKKKA